MASTNSKPLPSFGSKRIQTWPYWPRPPLWRTYLPSHSPVPLIVSRYSTCGAPTLTWTLNSLFILSTMMSKCNSPTPAIKVWPVSGFVLTRKVGSSSASFCKAMFIFSWSAFVFGSTASSITGAGNSIFSKTMVLPTSQSVSPVIVLFKPTTAPMSPAWSSGTSWRWLLCIKTTRPILSFTPLVEL